MEVINLKNNIIQVDFSNREELAKTFLRFQEFYESPKFKGKVFTLGSFKEWYSKQYGGFTYYTDWSGFNIPSHVLDIFRNGLFDPLTKKEKLLLQLLPASLEPYYIIGTFNGGKKDVLEHEICHGMFYSNKEYNSEVVKVLSANYSKLKPVFEYLSKLGYHEAVHLDEAHAYIGVDYKYLEKNGVKYPKNVKDKLISIRKKYGV